ncbi:MAG: IclR family transcriptional regulator C-terminal domain-containing protein [Pseudolysinimonas sp.]
MSQALLRGLALMEAVGQQPGAISELARRLGLDKAIISRLVTSAEADGWLVRTGGVVSLGPRAAALGAASPARSFERHAAEIAHAVAGCTGLDAMVYQFAGDRAHLLAMSTGLRPVDIGDTDVYPFPLFGTAIGLSLAAQLTDPEIAALLPEVLPAYTPRTATDHDEVARRIEAIRRGEAAREAGEFAEAVGCFALPWLHNSTHVPTAISCLGPLDEVVADEDLIVRVLRAAASPGATRATIVVAAGDQGVPRDPRHPGSRRPPTA